MDALLTGLTAAITGNPTFAAVFIIVMIIAFVVLTLVHINTVSLMNASNNFIKHNHVNWRPLQEPAQKALAALADKLTESDMKFSLGDEMTGLIILKDIAEGKVKIKAQDNGACPVAKTYLKMNNDVDIDKVVVRVYDNSSTIITTKE